MQDAAQNGWYWGGMGVGIVGQIATGAWAATALKGAGGTWAAANTVSTLTRTQQAALGYTAYAVAGDITAVAQSTNNLLQGKFSPLDTLGFLPTIGWTAGAYRGARGLSHGIAPVRTGLPELPSGYHYRTVGGKSVVVRSPGRAGDLPQMHLDGNVLKSGPVPRSTGGYWDWANVRQRLGASGWAESGQDVHHWMIPRNGWGKNVPDVVKNQKWNLMRMPSRSEHFRVHGWSFDGQPGYNLSTRLWRGTPTPAKLTIGGGIVVVGAGYYYFSE